MNKQLKLNPDGTVKSRGIEWTDATHNPISGCFHACQWEMPDGKVANCYAEDVADNVARRAYPQGFEHHYWKPSILDEPLKLTEPAKIFVGSMADNLGHWVPDEQIHALIDMCRKADWHTFQWLTKNPVRAKQFDFPDNCWVGTSSPPDFMWNKRLSEDQRKRLLFRALDSLSELDVAVRWMSIEPLSYDIGTLFEDWILETGERLPLEWAVIGAASNGPTYYQPAPAHLLNALQILDQYRVKVFFKGNLRPSFDKNIMSRWREDFPAITPPTPPKTIFKGVKPEPQPFEAIDYDMPWDEYVLRAGLNPAPTPPKKPTTVVNFQDVKDHWDLDTLTWDSDNYVYIGRYNPHYLLPQSVWGNPFRSMSMSLKSPIESYRDHIMPLVSSGKLDIETISSTKNAAAAMRSHRGYSRGADSSRRLDQLRMSRFFNWP